MTAYDWPQDTRDCVFYLAAMGSVVGVAYAVASVAVAAMVRMANPRA